MQCNLSGQVAIVTGGGGVAGEWSLGKAIALSLAKAGAIPFVLDLNRDAAEETCAAIKQEGFECSFAVADVSVDSEVDAAVQACVKQYGKVDILVNNAGIMAMGGVTEVSEADFDRSLAVNLKAMYLTSRHLVPLLRDSQNASIVNISSINSLGFASVPQVAYCVSKAGVNSLTEQIALENAAFGVRCNTIVVGMINTPMVMNSIRRFAPDADPADILAGRDAAVPLGKQGTVWDIANSTVFLCSDKAKFINGTKLIVDGGEAARFR